MPEDRSTSEQSTASETSKLQPTIKEKLDNYLKREEKVGELDPENSLFTIKNLSLASGKVGSYALRTAGAIALAKVYQTGHLPSDFADPVTYLFYGTAAKIVESTFIISENLLKKGKQVTKQLSQRRKK